MEKNNRNLSATFALLSLVTLSVVAPVAPASASVPVTAPSTGLGQAATTIYLYVNGTTVATQAVVTWGDGHVYDFASGNLIGVLNANGDIVAPGGAIVGFLPGFESEVAAAR